LSNLPEEIAAHYERNGSWLGLFTVVGLSCRIGQVKPEPGAYLWCCRQLGMSPGDVLFVDDQPVNVAAARESGMHGHLFTSLAELRPWLSDCVRG
jgi:putative hydrolase of the HAD superfamily